MIRSIELRGYKSFPRDRAEVIDLSSAVQTSKPVIFYGLNGAGKTAIGEVIERCAESEERTFGQCRLVETRGGPFRYLVYNHHFVDSVIGEAEGMPGIFTIGQPDTDAQRRIDDLGREMDALERDGGGLAKEEERIAKSIGQAEEIAKEEVWKIFKKYEGTSLDGLLDRYRGSKDKFFSELKRYANDEPDIDIGELEGRLRDVTSDSATLRTSVSLDLSEINIIERSALWSERIQVSTQSRLGPLVERLGSGDWVSRGRSFIHDDQCPFCQQQLPLDFLSELSKLLDGDREEKTKAVEAAVERYERALHRAVEAVSLLLEREPFARELGLPGAWGRVHDQIARNLANMQLKALTPSEVTPVEVTDLRSLLDVINTINHRIGEFNRRIQNKKQELQAIRELFWKQMYRDAAPSFRSLDDQLQTLRPLLADTKDRVESARRQWKEKRELVSDLKRGQEGIDASLESINCRLRALGVTSFSIAKKEGEGSLYCLQRPAEGEGSADSLSEGEKTLISFLYFLELLQGSRIKGAVVDPKKTIVVIDDPISSMSHNFIYDIASMIKHELVQPPGGQQVRQVIVLTHNLFFLHELVLLLDSRNLSSAGGRTQLLRVVKSECSSVVPLVPQDIANDYDAQWQIIRDAKERQACVQVVPNAMRCILETFFAFNGKSGEFEKILEGMSKEDANFNPLARFLNRGSHRDRVNIGPIDWSAFSIEYFIEKLGHVFREAGMEEHFRMKMGLGED